MCNKYDKVKKIKYAYATIKITNKYCSEGDIRMMQGFTSAVYRLRVGKFRVIYNYIILNEQQVLVIREIGSRGDIYK